MSLQEILVIPETNYAPSVREIHPGIANMYESHRDEGGTDVIAFICDESGTYGEFHVLEGKAMSELDTRNPRSLFTDETFVEHVLPGEPIEHVIVNEAKVLGELTVSVSLRNN